MKVIRNIGLCLALACTPVLAGVPGDELVISEVVDGTFMIGLPKYVEVTNCGGTTIDLSLYSIGNYNNGNMTLGGGMSTLLVGMLAAGDSYVFAYEAEPLMGEMSIFEQVYGILPDQFAGGGFINGDDVIALFLGQATGDGSDATLIDVYGEIGVDGTGEAWDYTDSFARRNPGDAPTTLFDSNNWLIAGPDFLEGATEMESQALMVANTSPGAHSCTGEVPCGSGAAGSCVEPNGTPNCADLACCQTVVGLDPDCAVAWDQGCVDLALVNCFECGDPETGSCLEDNGTPYCFNPDCCADVCQSMPSCCNVAWDAACAAAAQNACVVGGPAPNVQINEIRVDQPGSDDDEYFEVRSPGQPFLSLDGVSYVVIGDSFTGGSGVVEAVIDLSGNFTISELILVAESTFGLGMEDLLADLNFENGDNVTHTLLFNFLGNVDQDLDTDDDGILDIMPWETMLDSVSLIGSGIPGETDSFPYSPNIVGPSGVFVPGHVYRCTPEGTYTVGQFDPAVGQDTPGDVNLPCSEVCGLPLAGNCFEANGSPGCDNDACCEQVCATAGFESCCDLAGGWTAECAQEALVSCLSCGEAATGSCLEDTGTPYCNDVDCCTQVCATPGFESCCTGSWDAACAAEADANCIIIPPVQAGDVILGLSAIDPFISLELARGPAGANGGMVVPDFWEEPFIQSLELDNLDGIPHNPQGNLIGVNFGATASGGTIHSLATCSATSTDQQIGDTNGLGGSGVTLTRLGGLSISPDNTKIAVAGYDTGELLVYDYTPGNCNGAGAQLDGARQSLDSPLVMFDTQGTAWLDNNTVIGFATSGEIFEVDATTMNVTVMTTVDTASFGGAGPGFTDIEYNPAVSPNIYAVYSAFPVAIASNALFVLDTSYNELGMFTYDSTTGGTETIREIGFDSAGNLYASTFGASVALMCDAANLDSLSNDGAVNWYTSANFASFNGLAVASGAAPSGCAPDLDGDGDVDAGDLAQLLGAWGGCPPPCEPAMPGACPGVTCAADLNGDCLINALDLAQLLGAWGLCPA